VKCGKRQEVADFESAGGRRMFRIAPACPPAVQRCDTMDAMTDLSVTKVWRQAEFPVGSPLLFPDNPHGPWSPV
jgi:hypothetical protein